ncbi:DUF92 domain-containing protein, partial [Candidatus Micrarchaeota archaeon]|nr:DUF92 domain-containing protein [Candidatus Micrarchaeota archaeon]
MVLSYATILVGLIVALAIAIYAFKRHELSEGGTMAALFVGLTIFVLGGWSWFLILIVFFVTSSLFTKYKKEKKKAVNEVFEKGGTRDFWQVFANGFLPVLFASLYFLNPERAEFFVGFVAAIATVTADTWATEIGVFFKNPRSLFTFKKVPAGTSGAVSWQGLLVAFGGALLIGLVAVLFNGFNNSLLDDLPGFIASQFVGGKKFILFIGIAGFIGALADSLIGATIQAN